MVARFVNKNLAIDNIALRFPIIAVFRTLA